MGKCDLPGDGLAAVDGTIDRGPPPSLLLRQAAPPRRVPEAMAEHRFPAHAGSSEERVVAVADHTVWRENRQKLKLLVEDGAESAFALTEGLFGSLQVVDVG